MAAGDLLARLETRELEADLQRAVDGVHDVEFARQVAELELLEATAALESTVDGEGSLTLEESRTGLALTEKKAARLRREVANLEPLLDRGFITGDELDRAQSELETAEADLAIARRRARVLVEADTPGEPAAGGAAVGAEAGAEGRGRSPAGRGAAAGGGAVAPDRTLHDLRERFGAGRLRGVPGVITPSQGAGR